MPDTVGSDGAELGEVLLPPQVSMRPMRAKIETAWHVRAQHSRRVENEGIRSPDERMARGWAMAVPA